MRHSFSLASTHSFIELQTTDGYSLTSTQSREQNVTFPSLSTPVAGVSPVVCPRRTRTCVFTQPRFYLAVRLPVV